MDFFYWFKLICIITAFNGDCRICGLEGYKEGDCWKKWKNSDKGPPHIKSMQPRREWSEIPKTVCTYCGIDNHTETRGVLKKRWSLIEEFFLTYNEGYY